MEITALPLAILALVARPAVAPPPPLALVETVPLPGVTGRFDHFALDAKGLRLFVAALGNDTLEVLDVRAGRRLKSISGIPMPTGVVYLSDSDRVGVASGGAGRFELFEEGGYSRAGTVSFLDDADNVRWGTKTDRVYIG